MNSDFEQRIERLERANHRFRWTIFVLVMLVPATAAVMQRKSDSPTTAPPNTQNDTRTEPRLVERDVTTTGRTLKDIPRDYTPQLTKAAAKRETAPETPRRPLRIVDAEAFAVVDHDGNVRAEIGVDDQKAACLRMYDREGRRRIELMESTGVATLRFFDAEGTSIVELRQAEGGGQISLGPKNDAGKPVVQLISEAGKNGVFLCGAKPHQSLSLELDRGEGPQLNLTGAETHGRYRSNGMHIASNAGGLNFYLTPGKRAALSFSACPPLAGKEGVEIETSPGAASLELNSLSHTSSARLTVEPDATILNLKPSTREAVAQWSIRDHGTAAHSSILMRSDRGQEAIQIDLDESGPRMNLFNTKGEELHSARTQK